MSLEGSERGVAGEVYRVGGTPELHLRSELSRDAEKCSTHERLTFYPGSENGFMIPVRAIWSS